MARAPALPPAFRRACTAADQRLPKSASHQKDDDDRDVTDERGGPSQNQMHGVIGLEHNKPAVARTVVVAPLSEWITGCTSEGVEYG